MPTSSDKRRAALARIEPAPRLDDETLTMLRGMSDEQAERNARDDPDALPSTSAQLAEAIGNKTRKSEISSPRPNPGIAGFFSRLFGG